MGLLASMADTFGLNTPTLPQPNILGFGDDKKDALGDRIETNRTLNGRLIYAPEDPVTDMKIRLLVDGEIIGSTRTDNSGEFKLNFKLDPGRFASSFDYSLAVLEKERPFQQHGLNVSTKEVVRQRFDFTRPVDEKDVDAGERTADFNQIPENVTDVMKPPKTHEQSLSWQARLIEAAAPSRIVEEIVKLFHYFMSLECVQGMLNTLGLGGGYKPIQITSDNLIQELLNDVSAVPYEIEDDQVVWMANFDEREFDREESLPNVMVVADQIQDGSKNKLRLNRLEITFRGDEEPTVVRPGDKNFQWAGYVTRGTFAMLGELDNHLAAGHVLPGLIARSFFKYLGENNPLFKVLAPHLGQLWNINYFGSQGVIFGKGSVLEGSALTENGVAEEIVKAMGSRADWRSYKPEEPICDRHYRAQAQVKFFEEVKEFFENYVHDHKEEIKENWSQVYQFSRSFHKRFDQIPPIATSNVPTDQEIYDLPHFMAWLFNLTTFHHWSAHARQHVLLDVRNCSLAIEKRALNEKGELDPFGNTSMENLLKQAGTAQTLERFDGDALINNPYGNMDKDLLKVCRDVINNLVQTNPGYADGKKLHITTQI